MAQEADEQVQESLPGIGDALSVKTVEGSGFIRDDQGHEWAVPDENAEDLDDLGSKDDFHNLKYDPAFHYQLIGERELDLYRTRGFVPVTRKEVGYDDTLLRDAGISTTSFLQREGAIMVKIPKVFADRWQKQKERIATAAMAATEPTDEMLAQARKRRRPMALNVKDAEGHFRGPDDGFAVEFDRKSYRSNSPKG